ncbi:hypothetical protein SBA7_10054 [Candidatus Sulfotelmatobacter sp. SbA7]|nr:hypothetical protein SBA7_10054 [Candidatus Sulfotelmatobacter sp. SbA7]
MSAGYLRYRVRDVFSIASGRRYGTTQIGGANDAGTVFKIIAQNKKASCTAFAPNLTARTARSPLLV